MLIGLGISFPASPKKCALVVDLQTNQPTEIATYRAAIEANNMTTTTTTTTTTTVTTTTKTTMTTICF